MNRAARFCVLMGAVILFTAPAMVAQFTTASLGGVVSDSSGAVVPGAKLTLNNQQTGLSRTATSDAQGH